MLLKRMLEQNKSIIQAYCQHPFNQQLYNGTLPQKAFMWFLKQDAVYLKNYANVLQKIAQRFAFEGKSKEKELFLHFKKKIIAAEQNVNSKYIQKSTPSFFPRFEPVSPEIMGYINHLNQTVDKGTTIEATAACYPCFYLYAELGKQNKGRYPQNHYSNWTASYSSSKFLDSTAHMTDVLTELSRTIPEEEQQSVIDIFTVSAMFELKFCQAAFDTIAQPIISKPELDPTPRRFNQA